jgi:hypothetical protein
VSRPIPRDRKIHGSVPNPEVSGSGPRTVGHPAGGVVGFVSLGELGLAIRVFANHKFRKERLGHPANLLHRELQDRPE